MADTYQVSVQNNTEGIIVANAGPEFSLVTINPGESATVPSHEEPGITFSQITPAPAQTSSTDVLDEAVAITVVNGNIVITSTVQ